MNNNNNNINLKPVIRNNLNNFGKTVYDVIKLPGGEYEYYDKYLPDHLKKYFMNPIGLYDPYGNNINPFTGKPYQNIYKDAKLGEYAGGPLGGQKFNQTYINWAYIWSPLRLNEKTTEIINSVRNNTVTIIKAGTGVGKSLLGGRIISQAFNYQKKIIMTLPKRFVAKSTALDTAITADVVVGEEIGYYFKGEYMVDQNGKETKLIFTTTGSLIRKLTGDDPYLEEYSAIIIDEAHERSVQTDELILFIKKALEKRPDLKVIFISATLDLELFKNYYNKYSFNVVDLGEETTYHIEDIWEKEKPVDWQRTAGMKVMSILKENKKGDILVFVKSLSDSGKIKQYIDQEVKKLNRINDYQENPFMVGLNSGAKNEDKEYAKNEFKYLNHPDSTNNKPFTRKIVFATNVAESSVTIAGIIYVIDSGLELNDLYEPNKNANALLEEYISQSAIKQRRGRVGRTKPGVCYHLYTEKDYEKFIKYPVPSIEKSDLTMDILDIMNIPYIKNFGDVVKLLNEMMSPPKEIFIKSAQLNLYSMEAITSLDDNATLTPLGKAITSFSGIPIQLARVIIASYYYHCKYDVIPIIVILIQLGARIENLYMDFKPKKRMNRNSPEYKKEEAEYKKKQHQFDSKMGDIITIHNVYSAFREYMKLPKEYAVNNINVNNINLNGNNIIQTNDSIDLTKITKKTYKDAISWCIENGISTNIFIKKDKDKRKMEKNWDKVGNDSRLIDRKLMNIVQPSELRHKNHTDYKNDGGTTSKNKIKEEIILSKSSSNVIDPESVLKSITSVVSKDDNSENTFSENNLSRNIILPTNKTKSKKVKKTNVVQQGGLKKELDYLKLELSNNYVQSAGFNKKSYEVNFFPDAVRTNNKDDNILFSFAHGLYINIAKKISDTKYKTCYPFQKTLSRVDPKSTISLATKPAFLFYIELIMLRIDQKELKMNSVTKFPTKVIDMIKTKYKKYIEDCYKTNSHNLTKEHHKVQGKHKQQHRLIQKQQQKQQKHQKQQKQQKQQQQKQQKQKH